MALCRTEAKVALLAIHPEFANLIMHGEKKVEFRKTRFQSDISHVVIYATRPVAGIVAYFTVRQVVELPIQQLWAKYKSVGGVDEQRFQDYYRYRETGIAIEVGEVIRLKRPIPLRSLSETAPIPQSFVYLPREAVEFLKSKTKSLARVGYSF